MRETLRFQPNVPEVVALAFAEGREVEGRFGNQVMFTLEDDRVMYLDPPVAEKLKELGIRKGQEFQVVKREIVDGKRRSFEWKIEAVKLAAAAPPAAKREKAAAQPETPERVQAQPNTNGAAKTNGNGHASTPVPFVGAATGSTCSRLSSTRSTCVRRPRNTPRPKGANCASTTRTSARSPSRFSSNTAERAGTDMEDYQRPPERGLLDWEYILRDEEADYRRRHPLRLKPIKRPAEAPADPKRAA
jgi:hypothetical protein